MKRGGPIKRRTPLRRGSSRLKRTSLRSVNRERMKRLRAEQFGYQAEACRRSPCCACGKAPPSDPHHLKSRALGGKDRDCVPLCRGFLGCHSCFHILGRKKFEEIKIINLDDALRSMRGMMEWKRKFTEYDLK